MDTMLLLAQTISTGLLGLWMAMGARNNLLFPHLNEPYTAEVLEMRQMKTDYPEVFAPLAHRALTNRSAQRWMFRMIVTAEVSAALVLLAGLGALSLALLGLAPADTARGIALAGALLFTVIWACFLIVGEQFCYWFCHGAAQNTHYQMTLWGLGTMILLAQ